MTFTHLNLSAPLLQAIEKLSFEKPTPIQEQAIPVLLSGQAIAAQAVTGSGKTAAYALPLLQTIRPEAVLQALVLAPTRELAIQISAEIKSLGSFIPQLKVSTFYGGHPFREERASLSHSPHILVATPGRLLDHLQRETLSLKSIKMLVIDEADKMLSLGFEEALTEIMMYAPADRQMAFFSATWPDAVKRLLTYSKNPPIFIKVDAPEQELIWQGAVVTESNRKWEALHKLLLEENATNTLVFSNTRQDVMQTAQWLRKKGWSIEELHGEMQQQDRERALIKFRNGTARLLIATDLASRGLDITGLPLVVQTELPDREETYLHRIGRTGRAGQNGKALIMLSPREAEILGEWPEANIQAWIPEKDLPTSGASQGQQSEVVTLHLSAGKKEKLSKGDIAGALIQVAGLAPAEVGRIDVLDHFSYVAVPSTKAKEVIKQLNEQKIKGKKVKASVAN
jgi:ATP-dependent RNA helicase DbpA